jgi:hypothetical protein
MRQSQVNGFLVVRRIGMDRDPGGRAFYPAQASCIGALCYGGIDRMPWFDLDEEFYNGTLPASVKPLREALDRPDGDLTGLRLCQDLSAARSLLEFNDHSRQVNELIAVHSDKLAEIKGTLDFDGAKGLPLGFDIVSLGNWSLIREGLFRSPSFFHKWKHVVNEFGLLHAPAAAHEYVGLYETAALAGEVEELPGSLYGIDVIEVKKVLT